MADAPYLQLQMVWPDDLLDSPPAVQLAEGYHLRLYRPGDEERFYEVMALSGWPGWNDEKLAPWLARIPPGSWFMAVHTTTGQIVATAMGLHDHSAQHPFGGELGWIASDPAHRGKGLGKAVSAAVTARLLAAGYRNVHLYTEHWRLPAIKSYLQLGYVPYFYADEMPGRWHALCTALEWPYTPERWRVEGTLDDTVPTTEENAPVSAAPVPSTQSSDETDRGRLEQVARDAMNDQANLNPPPVLARLYEETAALGFAMASEVEVGVLLRTLAASKPGGVILELGTGTGLATAWLLAGMSEDARLISVERDPMVLECAIRHLGGDARVTFTQADGVDFLRDELPPQSIDLIFADTWPGKYTRIDEALTLLKPGGLYVIDDMLPQPNWPDGHAAKAVKLIADLEQRPDLVVAKLPWASGVIIAAKVGAK